MTELPILLPPGFTPLVSVGDTVTEKQILAEKKSSESTAIINIPTELSLPVQKTAKTIRMNPGDTIQPGDTIAVRSGFLGMGEQKVLSGVHGKISSYERRTGDLTIQLGDSGQEENASSESILSPVAGEVTVCHNDKIVVATEKEGILPEKGIGGGIQGELVVIKSTPEAPLPLHLLTPDTIGKIIMTPILDREGILKAIGIGIVGIVVSHLEDEEIVYLESKGTDTPILKVAEADYSKIAKWAGKQVYLEGVKKSIILLQT